jgi:hypothetical protein
MTSLDEAIGPFVCSADSSLDVAVLSLLRSEAISSMFSVASSHRIKPHVTSTACVFFHRFFARRSLRAHDRLEIGLACLLVAAKSTDFAGPIGDLPKHLAKEFLLRRGPSSAAAVLGGAAPGGAVAPLAAPQPPPPVTVAAASTGGRFSEEEKAIYEAKEKIFIAERLLLSVLGYKFDVVPPTLALDEALGALRSPPSDVLLRMAHSALHDALKTTLPLVYSAPVLARGALQFAHNSIAAAAARTGATYTLPQGWDTVVSLETLPVPAATAIAQAIADLVKERSL